MPQVDKELQNLFHFAYINIFNQIVSSRISQHFKRCKEKKLTPMIGKLMINNNPRKFKYYLLDPQRSQEYENVHEENGYEEEDNGIDILGLDDF